MTIRNRLLVISNNGLTSIIIDYMRSPSDSDFCCIFGSKSLFLSLGRG